MKRRAFIKLLGGSVAAWPLAAGAQQSGKMPTIGVLMAGSEGSTENKPRIAALRQGLAELGWKEGENIRVVYRWSAGKRELIDQYAKELVALNLNAIVANSTPVIAALHKLNPSTPVVFAWSGEEPVASGRQLHRLHLHRSRADREMDAALAGCCPRSIPGGASV
jgi:putative ABC transport system substrate-binding protein